MGLQLPAYDDSVSLKKPGGSHETEYLTQKSRESRSWSILKGPLLSYGCLVFANDLSGCCLAEGITRKGLTLVINYSHWLNYRCLLTLYNINIPLHTKLMDIQFVEAREKLNEI